MTHDPFQTYANAMLGGYSGVPTLQPFTQQAYGQFPGGLNPFAQQQQPFTQQQPFGQQQLGISPFQGGQQNPFAGFQQQHNPYLGFQQHPLAALQQNPWLAAIQNPLIAATLQNPLLQNQILQNPILQNPMLQNPMLQNPMLHPLVAQAIAAQQQYQQTGLGGTPFGQTGYPLAPQSWIGQGQQTGQIHPLYQQLAARAFTPGINPWAGY